MEEWGEEAIVEEICKSWIFFTNQKLATVIAGKSYLSGLNASASHTLHILYLKKILTILYHFYSTSQWVTICVGLLQKKSQWDILNLLFVVQNVHAKDQVAWRLLKGTVVKNSTGFYYFFSFGLKPHRSPGVLDWRDVEVCPLWCIQQLLPALLRAPSSQMSDRSLGLEVASKVSALLFSHGEISGPHRRWVLWRKDKHRHIQKYLTWTLRAGQVIREEQIKKERDMKKWSTENLSFAMLSPLQMFPSNCIFVSART